MSTVMIVLVVTTLIDKGFIIALLMLNFHKPAKGQIRAKPVREISDDMLLEIDQTQDDDRLKKLRDEREFIKQLLKDAPEFAV